MGKKWQTDLLNIHKKQPLNYLQNAFQLKNTKIHVPVTTCKIYTWEKYEIFIATLQTLSDNI